MARKKHAEHHDEHADETWLIPYSDMLTLLLALFIVLFASAQVDQKKIDQLSRSFIDAFHADKSILPASKDIPQFDEPITPPKSNKASTLNKSETEQAYLKETVELLEVKKVLDKYITDNNLSGMLETSFVDEGLTIRIREAVLFQSGSADLLPESRKLGAEIAQMLAQLNQKIVISGHTDNVPINTPQFPTNWDLSSKRALNFMKYMLTQDPKLQPQRFSAIGYGEYRPIASNTLDDGKGKNRRVEVLIIRNVMY